MNTLKMITGILFFLQCFTFTVLAESLPKFAMTISIVSVVEGPPFPDTLSERLFRLSTGSFPIIFIAISRNTTAKKTRFLLTCMN